MFSIRRLSLEVLMRLCVHDIKKRFRKYMLFICTYLTLSLREKINYLGFSPKFNHRIIASRGFQIRKDFCDISFRFQDIGITLVLIFFLTVHIFEFF